jgi:hypothetical protein
LAESSRFLHVFGYGNIWGVPDASDEAVIGQ